LRITFLLKAKKLLGEFMASITLLGLGPGDPGKLTREAWDILGSAVEIWLRTKHHPTVNNLPPSLTIHSFDDLYETRGSYDDVYQTIIEKILELGQRKKGVIYAVPGDPFIAEATCPEIADRAHTLGLPLRIVNGISFFEPVFTALGLDPYPRLTLIDALTLSQEHIPSFPPDTPVLIAQLYSRMVAAEVKMTLNSVFPDEHPVKLVHAAGTRNEMVESLPLFEIDRSEHIGLLSVLYLPSLGEGTSFESFQEVIARLRAPEGCPWDREQTHQSLRAHLLDEAYEALVAMDSEEPARMIEEFGDLLLQIVLNAQIGIEEGEFGMSDILKSIHDKIIRRHPHVFGDVQVEDVEGVLTNWERIKDSERLNENGPNKGLLDGIPLALPALIQAQEYQDRVARVGFDWPEIIGVLEKITEEIKEVRDAIDETELASELGDLFFALVNLARWKKVDAESALRGTNMRFKKRFSFVEEGARNQNKMVSELSLDELETLWQKAKRQ
jgi:tetrapyrrole methylase family protein/MazG family protein